MKMKLKDPRLFFFSTLLSSMLIAMTVSVHQAYATETQRSPLDILEIQPGVGEEEIKKSYKRLALKHHPDRNGDSREAHERFIEIQQAYEFLKKRDFKTSDLKRNSMPMPSLIRDPQEIRDQFLDKLTSALFPEPGDRMGMEDEVRAAFRFLESLKDLERSFYSETLKEGLQVIETVAQRTSDWQEEQRLYALLFSLQSGCSDFLKD